MLNERGKFSSIAYGSSEAIVVHWSCAGNVEKGRRTKEILEGLSLKLKLRGTISVPRRWLGDVIVRRNGEERQVGFAAGDIGEPDGVL